MIACGGSHSNLIYLVSPEGSAVLLSSQHTPATVPAWWGRSKKHIMGAAGTGAETMFVATVALLLVAQCVWSSPSAISPACSISCIREDDFVCLEQALLHGNKTNLKNLRSAIFQPNMPIPRCVRRTTTSRTQLADTASLPFLVHACRFR